MTLEFRTARSACGHCKYLMIDTDAHTYTRSPAGWICKETPQVRACDLETLAGQCARAGYKEV